MGFGYGLLVELGDVARKEGDIGKKRKGIGWVWWEMEWLLEGVGLRYGMEERIIWKMIMGRKVCREITAMK